MNFGFESTINKQKDLVSIKNKIVSKSKVSALKIFIFLIFLVIFTAGFLLLGIINGVIQSAPEVDNVSILPSSYSTTVYDTDKKRIAKLVTSGSNRIRVDLSDVPEHLQWAFIDTEDYRFYEHNGIDIQGIGRAAFIALSTQNASEGASTLTQQVLKNNVFTDWTEESSLMSSLKRKIQEQYLALQLEKTTDKKTILETYLNTINLGSNTLGVQAASQRYFNKSVKKLTLSESAVIAGITQNPAKFNPINNPEANAKRREKILRNMLTLGHITQEEYNTAMADNVYKRIQKVNTKITKNTNNVYSYFVDEVIKQVMSDLQNQKGYTYTQAYNAVYSGGLKIYSTQDNGIQKICDKELSDSSNYPYNITYSFNWAWSVQNPDGTVDNYDETDITNYHVNTLKEKKFNLLWSTKEGCRECVKKYKKHLMKKYYKNGIDESKGYSQFETIKYIPQPQASFSVMDQYTGYVKAITGGRGSKTVSLSLDRATDSTRQPGSTFKVLSTYAPAIDTMGYTLDSKITDAPYNYTNGRPVKNWYKGYRGTVTVRKAIADSMNVCAVKTLAEITPQLGYEYLLNFGLTTLDEKNDIHLATALGGITRGVTNLEMTGAYAAIANDGLYTRPSFYTKVVDSSGNILLNNEKPATHTVLKSSTATLLTQGMTSVVTEGTGKACKLKGGMPVSGKTGTTSSSYDLWFCGFTPYLTASIWTGYDENKELAGDQAYHERLWANIMNQINELKKYKKKKFKISKDVKKYYSSSSHGEYFAKGTEPNGWYAGDDKDKDDDDSYDYDYNYDYNSNSNSETKSSKKKTSSDKKPKATAKATQKAAVTKAPKQTAANNQAGDNAGNNERNVDPAAGN